MNALSDYFGRNLAVFSPSVFDSIFNDIDKAFGGSQGGLPFDVYAVDKDGQIEKYEIVYAAAGYTKKDVSIQLVGDELWIEIQKGLHGDESEPEKKYIHKGICSRTHKGKFKLAGIVDKDNIKTSFKDGLLTITLPVNKKENRYLEIEE